jgi:ketosteroid isomerase-like protein
MAVALNPERAVEILESCFAAVAAQDADRLVAHYTDDYVIEFPYYKPGEWLTVEGRATVRDYLASILEFQHMELTITRSNWIPDEQLLIAEYVSRGEFTDTGEPYANCYVGYWYFEGERVRHTREYYNPQAPRSSAIG